MKTMNMKTWPRARSFSFYKEFEYPQFNVCVQVDVTKTYQYLAQAGISKFKAMLWLLSLSANAVPEIRCRIRGDRVVEHERVDPSFTFLTEEKTLAFCLAEFSPDVSVFFNRVDQAIERTRANPLLEDPPGVDNLLFVSCVPWINFTSISHPLKMGTADSVPRISWGKFSPVNGGFAMPVSLQLHHGLADGYHAGLFFEKLEGLLSRPDSMDWPRR